MKRKKKYPLLTKEDLEKEREEIARLILIRAAFKIVINKRKNGISMHTNAFIEDMKKGKEHLTSPGLIERIDKVIKKLEKVIKRMERLSGEVDMTPLWVFK